MFVNRINISREGYFGAGYGKPDHSKPFRATLEVEGQHGKIELNLNPDMSSRIVALIADEIVAAGRATADAMTASILAVEPTKAIAA